VFLAPTGPSFTTSRQGRLGLLGLARVPPIVCTGIARSARGGTPKTPGAEPLTTSSQIRNLA
jgi:hypothetical protein